jgi:hypothetical protein
MGDSTVQNSVARIQERERKKEKAIGDKNTKRGYRSDCPRLGIHKHTPLLLTTPDIKYIFVRNLSPVAIMLGFRLASCLNVFFRHAGLDPASGR